MTELDATAAPALPRGVRLHWCAVRETWYLLAPERAVKLDAIGAAILQETTGEAPLSAVVDRLAAKFGAPADRVAADVGAFLADLRRRRMMEFRP